MSSKDICVPPPHSHLLCSSSLRFHVLGARKKHKDNCPMKGLIKGKTNFSVQETKIILSSDKDKRKENPSLVLLFMKRQF